MKAIILCTGGGIKSYPLTKDTPKPLLPVRRRPIVEYIINRVQMVKEIDKILILTEPQFMKTFKMWVDNFASFLPIELISKVGANFKNEKGGVRDLLFIWEQKKINDDLLVIEGNNLFSFSLNKFVDFAKERQSHCLIGAYQEDGNVRCKKESIVRLDNSGRVVELGQEVSKRNGKCLVPVGIYFFPREKISLIEKYLRDFKPRNAREGIDNYIAYLSQKECVYGYLFEGFWLRVVDVDSYFEAVVAF